MPDVQSTSRSICAPWPTASATTTRPPATRARSGWRAQPAVGPTWAFSHLQRAAGRCRVRAGELFSGPRPWNAPGPSGWPRSVARQSHCDSGMSLVKAERAQLGRCNMSMGADGKNPYEKLPARAFWKPSVAERSAFDLEGLWTPKFPISRDDRIACFGSCFAQHIGRALKGRGYEWLITEPAPPGLSAENARRFNYDLFTCRTGNIYTTSLLRQWTDWATGSRPEPDEVWVEGDRAIDPFRPRIEPNGFESVGEMRQSRSVALKAFSEAIRTATVFVFTLGLTEGWSSKSHGHEYPMCPGTAGGTFVADEHDFFNQRFVLVLSNLIAAVQAMRSINPELKILLTVSPVPLTATASEQHVMVATMRSKSILRAVAAELAETDTLIDYFPSYELVASPPLRGMFFEPNLRSVNPHGVSLVMRHFFTGLGDGKASLPAQRKQRAIRKGEASAERSDVVCEEQLLAAFGPSG